MWLTSHGLPTTDIGQSNFKGALVGLMIRKKKESISFKIFVRKMNLQMLKLQIRRMMICCLRMLKTCLTLREENTSTTKHFHLKEEVTGAETQQERQHCCCRKHEWFRKTVFVNAAKLANSMHIVLKRVKIETS